MLKRTLVMMVLLFLSMTANAVLFDRGNGLIYDDVLNVTWLQDANYAQTSGFDADGGMNWFEGIAWADQLVYAGFDDWRLPFAGNNPEEDYGATTSELGNLFYSSLGNVAGPTLGFSTFANYSFTDGSTGNLVSFFNIQPGIYWLDDLDGVIHSGAYAFDARDGFQFFGTDTSNQYNWALRSGDVASIVPPGAVPVPAALWLFFSGLLMMIGVTRRHIFM